MWCAVSISSAIICHLAVFDLSLIVCLLFYHVFGGQLKLLPVFTGVLGFSFWCGFCSVACFFIVARFQSSVKYCSYCHSLSLVCSISFILFLGFFSQLNFAQNGDFCCYNNFNVRMRESTCHCNRLEFLDFMETVLE